MADTKVFSNGYLNIAFIPINGLANPAAPTDTELNAGVMISEAVAFDGTTWPTMADSNDIEDRSILDAGNATSRGFASYEGSVQLFYPRDLNETATTFGKAFEMLRIPGGEYWVVTRILQNVKGQPTPFATGQYVSVYKFIADTFINDTEGEDSYKYTVELLQQGQVFPNTLVAPAGAITVTNASGSASLSVGDHAVLRAQLAGHRVTQLVTWETSDPDVAQVSPNGVVTGVGGGSADITATHPSGTASTPIAFTVA